MEEERPMKERIWEFTKDISIKVSRKAEKHWKINTLRVEIASIKHRINVQYKELGHYVYQSFKDETLGDTGYEADLHDRFQDLLKLETDIVAREQRIVTLEQEMDDVPPAPEAEAEPEPPEPPAVEPEKPAPSSAPKEKAEGEAKETDKKVETDKKDGAE
jgi:hypothetical protein